MAKKKWLSTDISQRMSQGTRQRWDDDLKEGEHQYGKPIGSIQAPRDLEDNEIEELDVDAFRERPKSLPSVSAKPHIDILLGSGYSVAALALGKMQQALNDGEEFDSQMANKYHKVIDAFSKLAREERAQEHLQDPGEMTDEELAAFLLEQQQKGLLPSGD